MNLNLIEIFLDKINAEDGLAKNTILSYRKDLELLEKFLISRKKTLKNCDEFDLKEYLKNLHLKNIKTSSSSRKISCFKNFFNFLSDEKIIAQNITENIETPKKNLKLPKMLSEDEVEKLISVAYQENLRTACMLEILYSSGLRVSELVSLSISSIQNEKDYLIVKGKGNKERIAPLNEAAKNVLQKYLAQRNCGANANSKWLFIGKNLKEKKDSHITRQGFHKALKDIASKAEINPQKVHPHIIRHSFASHLLNRGIDLRVLQELLGHSDISTTQIYTHILDSKLKDIVFKKHPLSKKN